MFSICFVQFEWNLAKAFGPLNAPVPHEPLKLSNLMLVASEDQLEATFMLPGAALDLDHSD